MKFTDGSLVEYVDRETVKYSEGEFSVLIWLDYYKVGILNYGRVVDIDSIYKWDTYPNGARANIDSLKKNDIYEKVKMYCKSKGWPLKKRVGLD